MLIAGLVPTMLASGWIGLEGLSATRGKLDAITGDNLRVTLATDQLGRDVSGTGELALQDIIATQPIIQGQLDARLSYDA